MMIEVFLEKVQKILDVHCCLDSQILFVQTLILRALFETDHFVAFFGLFHHFHTQEFTRRSGPIICWLHEMKLSRRKGLLLIIIIFVHLLNMTFLLL